VTRHGVWAQHHGLSARRHGLWLVIGTVGALLATSAGAALAAPSPPGGPASQVAPGHVPAHGPTPPGPSEPGAGGPAAPPSIDQLTRDVTAQVAAASTPQYDGTARLPQIPPTPIPGPKQPDNTRCTTPAVGQDTVCVGPARPMPQPTARKAQGGGARPPSVGVAPADDRIPLPDFCFGVFGWVATRTVACEADIITVTVLDDKTRLPVGHLDLGFEQLEAVAPSGPLILRQVGFTIVDGDAVGLSPGTAIAAMWGCTGRCRDVVTSFGPVPLPAKTLTVGLFSSTSTVVLSGDRGQVGGRVGFVMTHEGADGVWSPLVQDTVCCAPLVRCDNALPGVSSTGCVFADVVPVMQYDRQGDFPQLADHIGKAQDSGLPGAPGMTPLRRLTDASKRRANRRLACPQESDGGYTRPKGKSCDEYPVASSYEGASTTPNPGPARTFSDCSIPGVPTTTTGLAGYSVCMINARQNSLGGSALNTDFYLKARVIDNDAFYVQISGVCCGPGLPPDDPPTVSAGPDVTGFEGSRVDLHGSASDDDGPPALQWSVTPGPDVDPGAQCHVNDPTQADTWIVCTDDGTFTVTLSADDGIQDEPSTASARVRLTNVAPIIRRNTAVPDTAASTAAGRVSANIPLGIVTPTPWQLFRVGDPVTLTANFTDPGSNDTQTCAIAWDDGTTTRQDAPGSVCQATHRFTHAGMYTIRPLITDDDGGVSEATSVMVVVYDPAAGIGRGNGWLNPGGDGGFDFTASYPLRSATVPDGAVTFALPPAANLNLRNHQHLDWLVVTPDGKIAIKGTAERIPGQRVGFVLYGYYGCPAGQSSGCQPGPSRLRMVVWDSTAHGPIPDGVPAIYDNRAGTSFDIDDADPQPINQGVIVIQHPPIG